MQRRGNLKIKQVYRPSSPIPASLKVSENRTFFPKTNLEVKLEGNRHDAICSLLQPHVEEVLKSFIIEIVMCLTKGAAEMLYNMQYIPYVSFLKG